MGPNWSKAYSCYNLHHLLLNVLFFHLSNRQARACIERNYNTKLALKESLLCYNTIILILCNVLISALFYCCVLFHHFFIKNYINIRIIIGIIIGIIGK